jgi:hypothetical protein
VEGKREGRYQQRLQTMKTRTEAFAIGLRSLGIAGPRMLVRSCIVMTVQCWKRRKGYEARAPQEFFNRSRYKALGKLLEWSWGREQQQLLRREQQ